MTHNKSIRQEVIELETYKSNYIQKNYVECKVIIITGASSGFGKLTAKRAAEMGGKIVLAARSEEKLKETVAEIKAAGGEASYIVTDVAKKDDVFAMAKFAVDTYGRIDVLVNNAGITKDNLILKMKESDFDEVLGVNLKGAFNMIKSVYSHMAKRKSGRIINISSVSALLGTAGQANYVSSKAGLIGLTKTAARELGARGITCNAIAPGYIETDMTASLKEELKREYLEKIPAKRFGWTILPPQSCFWRLIWRLISQEKSSASTAGFACKRDLSENTWRNTE